MFKKLLIVLMFLPSVCLADCDISETLKFLVPSVVYGHNGNVWLKDDSDGGGIYIDRWDLTDPQPSMDLVRANIPNCTAAKEANAEDEQTAKLAILSKLNEGTVTLDDLPKLKDLVIGE